MDEEFQEFLHSQFDVAHSSVQDSEELTHLIEAEGSRYPDKEFLAEGGQKKIYKCQDLLTGRVIAYATLKNKEDSEQVAKFLREARLTAHLEHPHIIPVYDTGLDEENQPYFTMKLISGQTFEDYLKEGHSLPSCIDILIKVCEAVNFAHDNGVNHFDIKPDNIQVSEYGEVLLCDWGLAGITYECCSEEVLDDEILKKVDLSQSLDLQFKGTAGYAAPEMWEKKGERNHLCDIYSLGSVLYRVLAGKTAAVEVDFKNLQGPIALQAVCKKAMQKDISIRYQTTSDFIKDLKAWRNGFATEAENASFLTTLKLLILRHRNVSIAVFSALILIFFICFIFIGFLKVKEKRATDLAKDLQKTENARIALEKELSPKYLTQAFEAYMRLEYDAAMSLSEHVLRNDPESERAKEIKGLILFSEQKFAESIPYLKGNIKKLAEEFKDAPKPLSIGNLVKVFTRLDRSKRESEMYVYKNLLILELEKDIPVEHKRQIMMAEIRYKNKNVEDIHFELKETAEGWIIDLSDNPRIHELWILQKLGPVYVKNLNLNNTLIGGAKEAFEQMQIERLSMRGWNKNPGFLKGKRILHLDVQDSNLDVSSLIDKAPLVTLNIKNSRFKNWNVLKSLKFLEELTVSKEKIPASVLQELQSRQVKINY